jgi:vacuolar-type H+-ATPase subunit I/STV1
MAVLEVHSTVITNTTNEGAANTINFGIAYWTLSFTVNILVSGLIAGRLIWYRNRFRKQIGTHSWGSQDGSYLSIAAMIVESAAIYTVVGLTFLGLFATNNPAQGLLISVLGQVEVSPYLPLPWFLD